MLYHNFILFS